MRMFWEVLGITAVAIKIMLMIMATASCFSESGFVYMIWLWR